MVNRRSVVLIGNNEDMVISKSYFRIFISSKSHKCDHEGKCK